MGKRWSTVLTMISVFFLLYSFSGCTSAGITFGNRPPRSGGSPGEYRKAKGGPPPWAPAHGYRAKHQYRYYPDQRVYYDDRRGVYFYYHNGQWDASVNLPVGIKVDFGNHITLEMDTDKPYVYHTEIEATYPSGKTKNKDKKKGRGKKPKK